MWNRKCFKEKLLRKTKKHLIIYSKNRISYEYSKPSSSYMKNITKIIMKKITKKRFKKHHSLKFKHYQ